MDLTGVKKQHISLPHRKVPPLVGDLSAAPENQDQLQLFVHVKLPVIKLHQKHITVRKMAVLDQFVFIVITHRKLPNRKIVV